MIFDTFALSETYSEKYRSQEVDLNKLEKGPLIDFKNVFVHLWHLWFWRKRFLNITIFSWFFTSTSENI
jgi:hypothetical protein